MGCSWLALVGFGWPWFGGGKTALYGEVSRLFCWTFLVRVDGLLGQLEKVDQDLQRLANGCAEFLESLCSVADDQQEDLPTCYNVSPPAFSSRCGGPAGCLRHQDREAHRTCRRYSWPCPRAYSWSHLERTRPTQSDPQQSQVMFYNDRYNRQDSCDLQSAEHKRAMTLLTEERRKNLEKVVQVGI